MYSLTNQIKLSGQKIIRMLIDNKIIIPKKNDPLYVPKEIILNSKSNYVFLTSSEDFIQFDFNGIEIPILNKIQQIQLKSNQNINIDEKLINKPKKRGII